MMTITGAIAFIFALVHWFFNGGENMVPLAGCFLVSCVLADTGASALYNGLDKVFNPENRRK